MNTRPQGLPTPWISATEIDLNTCDMRTKILIQSTGTGTIGTFYKLIYRPPEGSTHLRFAKDMGINGRD
jgi:hypothetical protein